MDFVAIDVETANADMASICQIGVAKFVAGQLFHEWSTLVDPEDHFDGMNVSIHGIDEDMVAGHPTLPEVSALLLSHLSDSVCVSHMPFDRTAVSRAFLKYGLTLPTLSWLDSAAVARRTWTEVAQKGYGLKNVCRRIGYKFKHHDALEDAKAAGHLLVAALRETQCDMAAMQARVLLPIDPSRSSEGAAIRRAGSPEGLLHGEVVVFTGALRMIRSEAADRAARLGCEVAPGVTKKTTILVVGDQDVTLLAGHEKSSKHRKAEQLVREGQALRILRETDFDALFASA
jgi:DNA polymerase-3 subunit epsilon